MSFRRIALPTATALRSLCLCLYGSMVISVIQMYSSTYSYGVKISMFVFVWICMMICVIQTDSDTYSYSVKIFLCVCVDQYGDMCQSCITLPTATGR